MREKLEQLLAAGRDNALLRFGLGSACLQAGDARAAVVHLTQATQQQASYSAAWKLLGRALRELEQLDAAQVAWSQGLEVARQQGDLQSVKEMTVFLRRLQRRSVLAIDSGSNGCQKPVE